MCRICRNHILAHLRTGWKSLLRQCERGLSLPPSPSTSLRESASKERTHHASCMFQPPTPFRPNRERWHLVSSRTSRPSRLSHPPPPSSFPDSPYPAAPDRHRQTDRQTLNWPSGVGAGCRHRLVLRVRAGLLQGVEGQIAESNHMYVVLYVGVVAQLWSGRCHLTSWRTTVLCCATLFEVMRDVEISSSLAH